MMRHRRKHNDIAAITDNLSASEDEASLIQDDPQPTSEGHHTRRMNTAVLQDSLLTNMLGVSDGEVDQMLGSVDSAAKLLGVNH